MLVVSNTSPLSNLAIINRLDLLREQLGSVIIPPAVQQELDRHPILSAHTALNDAIQSGWITVVPITMPVPDDLVALLDLGEAEALTLATERQAELVLLDEAAARTQAHHRG